METPRTKITIEALVHAPMAKVWTYWTEPTHITHWNAASDDWCCPRAENDLRIGGAFSARMEARDGSMGFDFGGIYDEVAPNDKLVYTLGDGRKVEVHFVQEGDAVKVTEIFEAEGQNSVERQQDGWQAILNNFKKHAEEA